MNNNVFSNIAKEYSFLDDYETEIRERKTNSKQPPNRNAATNENTIQNKKFLNNYPEFENSPENVDEYELKRRYNNSRYGSFINKSLNPSKLNEVDYVYKNLEVDRNVTSNVELLENSDKQMLQDVEETIKKREIQFYAILNKEFNILNRKMISCSLLCYDNPKLFTVNEAKLCAESCHRNIKAAGKFAHDIQEEKKEKLLNCLDQAKDYELNKSDDKIASFFKCYEDLLFDFDSMEKQIKSEYSNYI